MAKDERIFYMMKSRTDVACRVPTYFRTSISLLT